MNFFQSQDVARKNTFLLVTLFSLAIISLIVLTNVLVMVVFGYLDSSTISAETFNTQFDWRIFMMVGAAVTGVAVTVLIIVGGALYSLGALIYGLKRPNPSPRWFGFHEVFHALTVAAFVVHYVAVSLTVYT